MTIKLKGIGASKGVALGRVFIKEKQAAKVLKKSIQSVQSEYSKLERAREQALADLKKLEKQARRTVGEEQAAIFEVHRLILEDRDFLERVKEIIFREKSDAAYGVKLAGDEFAALFTQLDDPYFRERSADFRDISQRLLAILEGRAQSPLAAICEPVIVAADDLYPSDTLQIKGDFLLGMITERGGETSHSSILARALQIPAVVGVSNLLATLKQGDEVIVDGERGLVIVGPDLATRRHYLGKQAEYRLRLRRLQSLKGTESRTADGVKIRLASNIAAPSDLDSVLENDAEGIGLFRTEFLYMQSSSLPSEELQFQAYRTVLEGMGEQPVLIRTLDVGGDKDLSYLGIPPETNPFLGYRAIRVSLERRDIFKTQLRALLRASVYGKLGIMFPLITSLAEVLQAKAVVEEVKKELRAEQLSFSSSVELGIMIETPAAALISDQLAWEVDFFSIGTNDLTQYTLAVDRMNPKVAQLYSPGHAAVLRLIQLTVQNAHQAGIWVGICGESAADLSLTETFIALGIDELSMNSSSILEVREKIQGLNAARARAKLSI